MCSLGSQYPFQSDKVLPHNLQTLQLAKTLNAVFFVCVASHFSSLAKGCLTVMKMGTQMSTESYVYVSLHHFTLTHFSPDFGKNIWQIE